MTRNVPLPNPYYKVCTFLFFWVIIKRLLTRPCETGEWNGVNSKYEFAYIVLKLYVPRYGGGP